MNDIDTKQEVWQALSDELVRRRRGSKVRRVVYLGVFLTAALFGIHSYTTHTTPQMADQGTEPGSSMYEDPLDISISPPEPTYLAVMVYNFEGPSLEMVDVSQSGPSELNFGLEPVVWLDSSDEY